MSDPTSPHIKARNDSSWGLYQRDNFWKLNDGEVPLFNTHPDKLEELAREILTQNGWYYASSNAGLSHTHLANRQAFFRHKIVPKQLVDTNERSMRTKIFGHEVSAPIGIAPIGINKIYHPRGELPIAKVAGELGIPYSLSTAGSCPIEDVAKANDEGHKATQESQDPQADKILPEPRFYQLYMPYDDVATSNYAFYRGIGADLGLTDPKAVWARQKWQEISGGKPFLIKGIQRVDDAEKAAELGFEGIVPLALGARFVFIGRLWIWGLSIMGETGVRHVMKGLLADMDILMNCAGLRSVDEIDRGLLESLPRAYGLLAEKSKL
ncbi:FMN-dependent dehydrogenase [Diaporthe sp. PMI_573]|nr:FMN-dependent dehydrogenase [Diaporthaceae sp. PMI_573]